MLSEIKENVQATNSDEKETWSQRNMVQMKEQIKTPGKKTSDEEIANLPDAEFKTLVVRMFTELIEFG